MLKQKVSFVIRETFVDALTTAYLKVMLIADLKATRPGRPEDSNTEVVAEAEKLELAAAYATART